jgi:hypothetical protein
VLTHAIEAEVADWIITGIGPLQVKQPRIHDRRPVETRGLARNPCPQEPALGDRRPEERREGPGGPSVRVESRTLSGGVQTDLGAMGRLVRKAEDQWVPVDTTLRTALEALPPPEWTEGIPVCR